MNPEIDQNKMNLTDLLNFGVKLNVIFAIDFSGSNGSLHYIDRNSRNQYEESIYQIGNILEEYDEDKNIPVYGFGVEYNNKLDHCFPLNFN